jgi:hypothetical protein
MQASVDISSSWTKAAVAFACSNSIASDLGRQYSQELGCQRAPHRCGSSKPFICVVPDVNCLGLSLRSIAGPVCSVCDSFVMALLPVQVAIGLLIVISYPLNVYPARWTINKALFMVGPLLTPFLWLTRWLLLVSVSIAACRRCCRAGRRQGAVRAI